MIWNRALIATSVLAAGMLAGCASHPYAYAYVPPPPPAPYRSYGVAPAAGYVWADGFFDLRGGRWVWVEGSYLRPPRPHAHWVPARWVRSRDGWSFRRGYWR